ncbi:hypothetical protein B0I33_112227 [Prauserella shujinwangii]|uniref:MYXO-CTERM domain-containing protein n=1 Tax=Prauserella shujinwangii TaxID=1453103 RepID=A0A2T0LMP3_9PSEU|nr:hypothetical protein B0I33_112227 [Prauserella shujinwangii]
MLIAGVLVVLVGVLACGGPAQAAVPIAAAEPGVAMGSGAPVLVQDPSPEPGPQLDPQTEADSRKTKNKLIVGGAALVLLLIVIWGRKQRNKNRPGK